ncbi:MAG: hypothetical protein U0X92_09910 [Anaerolineales bacterium]
MILFPEATHWAHLDAADEVNHYLIDFLLDSIANGRSSRFLRSMSF